MQLEDIYNSYVAQMSSIRVIPEQGHSLLDFQRRTTRGPLPYQTPKVGITNTILDSFAETNDETFALQSKLRLGLIWLGV